MSLGNFIAKKPYVDLDYVYGTLRCAEGENPLDFTALRENPMAFHAVATEAESGQVRYFGKSDIHPDDYSILKASSALSFACQPYAIGDTAYYDGALGDPVPVEKAFQLGCDRVVLLLTKPENVRRSPKKDKKVAACIRHAYPAAAQKLCQRARCYNESVVLAREYAKQGKSLIVAPEDTCGVATLTRDKQALHKLYQAGYEAGRESQPFCTGKGKRVPYPCFIITPPAPKAGIHPPAPP